MRLRSVSLAALLVAMSPVAVLAQTSVTPTAVSAAQAAELRAAPVSELVSEVNIPWTRFQLDNGLTVIVHEDR